MVGSELLVHVTVGNKLNRVKIKLKKRCWNFKVKLQITYIFSSLSSQAVIPNRTRYSKLWHLSKQRVYYLQVGPFHCQYTINAASFYVWSFWKKDDCRLDVMVFCVQRNKQKRRIIINSTATGYMEHVSGKDKCAPMAAPCLVYWGWCTKTCWKKYHL